MSEGKEILSKMPDPRKIRESVPKISSREFVERSAENQLTVSERTEEIQDIIERMPTSFAKRTTVIVCGIVFLLMFFGYVVKYPDIVSGRLSISASQAPLKLIVEQNGKLKINNLSSQDVVRPGQLIAWIDNPADPKLVDSIRSAIMSIKFPVDYAAQVFQKLPKGTNAGELTIPYSSFLTSLRQLADFQQNRLYDKQEMSLSRVLSEQKSALNTLKEKEKLSTDNVELSLKFLKRDSILLSKKIISQSEFDQTLASQLTAEDQLKTSLRNTGAIREQISGTENSIQQNRIERNERGFQLDLELSTAYNSLIDKINLWEKQFLITTPLAGKVQFLKFWNENQFVQAGEPVFSIVPEENELLGQVLLPVGGAGKVKVGQEVIVKLEDYPYMEYGYLRAVVKNISLVSTTINTGENAMDSYMVVLFFPNGMLTNYGTPLDFKFETKGIAEIITKDRRLIERFFDNLKYIGHSK